MFLYDILKDEIGNGVGKCFLQSGYICLNSFS
jgi:hypothetical protein